MGGYGGSTVPDGWQIVGYVHGVPELRPSNSEQSLSLPIKSKIPHAAYVLYNKKGVFKQLRVYGGDKRPSFDIDYHNIDGKMSLHKHIYKGGVRQKEHIPLTPEEYVLYSKFLNR